MKPLYILCTLALLAAACKPGQKLTQQQKADCERFQTGTFRMIDNPTKTPTVVVRNKKFQKEADGDEGMDLKINWLSACSYELIPADGSKEGPIKITVELSNVRGDTCDWKATPQNPEYPQMTGIFIRMD